MRKLHVSALVWGMPLTRWLAGAGLCVLLMALAAYALIDLGAQARAKPREAAGKVAVPATPWPVPLPREAEVITEMRAEEARPLPPVMFNKPEWAASQPQRSAVLRPRRVASAQQAAPAPARPPEVASPASRAVVSAPPMVRSAPVDVCQGQAFIAHALCMARQCSSAASRSLPQCAQIRGAEQKLKERMEQGG